MQIADILKMSVGQGFGGFDVTVKTCKKKWQDVNGGWIQQAVLTDKSGDMLVDVYIINYEPLQRGATLHITVGKVQESRIWIDQFVLPSLTEPEYDHNYSEPYIKEIEGKIRHGLVCADKSAGKVPNKEDIRFWTEFILTGK